MFAFYRPNPNPELPNLVRVHIGADVVRTVSTAIGHAHRLDTRALYTLGSNTRAATLYQQLSLQSCQVPVVNYTVWGMSLLETSSCLLASVPECCGDAG